MTVWDVAMQLVKRMIHAVQKGEIQVQWLGWLHQGGIRHMWKLGNQLGDKHKNLAPVLKWVCFIGENERSGLEATKALGSAVEDRWEWTKFHIISIMWRHNKTLICFWIRMSSKVLPIEKINNLVKKFTNSCRLFNTVDGLNFPLQAGKVPLKVVLWS